MGDPTTAGAAVAVTGAGITVFGLAIGLHPELLLAGFWGAMWSLGLSEAIPPLRRVSITGVSSVVAAYATPAVVHAARGLSLWPQALTGDVAQYPIAVLIGFGAHRVIGPAILRIAAKRIEEAEK